MHSRHWPQLPLIQPPLRVIESTREAQGNELKFKETYVLSPDGKGLTINNHVSVQGQEFDITFVFTKQ